MAATAQDRPSSFSDAISLGARTGLWSTPAPDGGMQWRKGATAGRRRAVLHYGRAPLDHSNQHDHDRQ
jgi:hypothetical protein